MTDHPRATILTILGTRPEAVKLAPVLKQLGEQQSINLRICVTGQHREMLDPFLRLFDIHPNCDLDIMTSNQDLFDVSVAALAGLKMVITREEPALVLVHGDTTTALMGAMAAFYLGSPIGHIEAGLRSGRKYDPFPEEANRMLIDRLSDLLFAPTEANRQNLLSEGIAADRVFVTGNTVIDALLMTAEKAKDFDPTSALGLGRGRKMILVTGHRRESFGDGLLNICNALLRIRDQNPDVEIVYPVHLNPRVRGPVTQILGRADRIHLIDPVDYVSFVGLMERAFIILTDSGGVQEEAPSLGKPVLVMRNATERPEAIASGAAKLVGTSVDSIVAEANRLLRDPEEYKRMASAPNPYGDGQAAGRIVDIILGELGRPSLSAPGARIRMALGKRVSANHASMAERDGPSEAAAAI
jgi:UDP-N-acetylglucosamine 2-epimerase (non-hydrolysing)